MNIYYDTEFIEDGRTIDLISIGMVTDDDREYYAVNQDMPLKRIGKSEWLMANVWPSLPKPSGEARIHGGPWPRLAIGHPDVKPRTKIAAEVRDFILSVPDRQMWAWYAAYDHVVLCQLWGRMIDLPAGVPMWTNDLKQEAERLSNPTIPPMPDVAEHNALSDAREVRFRADWLRKRA